MEETKHYTQKNALPDAPAIGLSEAALWGRLLEPVGATLSAEAARYLLNLRFPQSDLDRMRELAEKAREGSLILEEHIELDNYERVGQVLSLLKSKARKSLMEIRAAERLFAFSGVVYSGDPHGCANERIDADLTRAYADDHAALYRTKG
jgi:hypothetical protein